jgi:hypothetical protein
MWREPSQTPRDACRSFTLTAERCESWLDDHRYHKMDLVKEHENETLRQSA